MIKDLNVDPYTGKPFIKNGTKVEFDMKIQSLKGIGKIVGVAHNSQPIIGVLYIIKLEERIPNYDFDCICIYEQDIVKFL